MVGLISLIAETWMGLYRGWSRRLRPRGRRQNESELEERRSRVSGQRIGSAGETGVGRGWAEGGIGAAGGDAGDGTPTVAPAMAVVLARLALFPC